MKGRYAGEIRIELTFYDSRPKTEKAGHEQGVDTMPGQPSEQSPSIMGCRQQPVVSRRPLPADPISRSSPSNVSGGPPNHHGPRSYQTPPRQQQPPESSSSQQRHLLATASPYSVAPNQNYQPDARDLHQPSSLGSSWQQAESQPNKTFEIPAGSGSTGYNGPHDAYCEDQHHESGVILYNSDQHSPQTHQPPYEQLPEQHTGLSTDHAGRDRLVDRHGRFQRLHAPELYHTASAPQLYQRQSPAQSWQDGHLRTFQVLETNRNQVPMPFHTTTSTQHEHPSPRNYLSNMHGDRNPLPPPHRNSAPFESEIDSRVDGYNTSIPDPRDRRYFEHPQDQMSQLPITNSRPHQPYQSLERAQPMQLDHMQLYQYDHNQPGRATDFEIPSQHSYAERQFPDPEQYAHSTVPVVKPRAISPSREAQQVVSGHLLPRKSLSPPTAPREQRPTIPFSPDSFDSFNPNFKQSRPRKLSRDSKGPIPMYSSQSISQSRTAPQQPKINVTPLQAPQHYMEQSSEPSTPADGPIIGSDGKLKDPSDHLPPSSYAPEPELKGKRPTTVINIKNRFGPREAPSMQSPLRPTSLPPSATASTRPTAPARGQPPSDPSANRMSHIDHNRPLAPAANDRLNSDFQPSYPPPVPKKIPLTAGSGYANGIEDYEPGGNMAALSDEVQNLSVGSNNWQRGGRLRKSRFGA